MKKLLKSVIKLNLWFCVGILVVDTYGKICEMHEILNNITE